MMMKHFSKTLSVLALGAALIVSGCTTTGSGYKGGGVGPSSGSFGKALGSTERNYAYNKGVYLDVAIPILDPGFPMKNGYIDEQKLLKENIWPEIRRLESKRFSINMRDAISKTKAFGSVRVVPGEGASADLYVLGRINESNTMKTRIGLTVVDATNRKWGEKNFTIAASSGFYRDSKNAGKDPNRNIYTDIADWVYSLVQKEKSATLEKIQLVKEMRYAEMYSPQAFNRYLKQNNRGVIGLNALPADTDQLLTRVREYRAQDEAFVDALQESYDAFHAETETAYRSYQKEALPIQEKLAKERASRNRKALFAVVGTAIAAAGANQDSKIGDAVAVAGGIAAVAAVKGALDDNESIGEYKNIYDEMGQNLDLKVSPQVRSFEDKEVELSGTASEQYEQWRAHLMDIYRETETPINPL